MQHRQNSNFVWADLSTFDTAEAARFYSKVFGWKYKSWRGYNYAYAKSKLASGIFEMPKYLQEMNMPSFWMSYISVDSVEQTVAAARKVDGVVIEVDTEQFGDGKIALIRDPAGAGFTVYEGKDINSKATSGRPGRLVWNELVTDSISTIQPFYESVFGYQFVADDEATGEGHRILNASGEEIAGVTILNEEIRGEKVYWMPYFAVKKLEDTIQKVIENGGSEACRDSATFGETALLYDTQAAAFSVLETR